jgi:hypothetical protein
LWRHDDFLVELHHNKIRGPGFEPMTFRIEKITTPKLVEKKGRHIPTVHVVPVSESEENEQVRTTRAEENEMLAALAKGANQSIADLARACGWTLQSGEPHKSKAHRVLERLAKAKLVKNKRGSWCLTDDGIKVEREVRVEDRGGAVSDKPFAAVRGTRLRPGVPCAHCGGTEGEIFRIRDARVKKGHAESLHDACAKPWFCGEPQPERTGKSD